MLFAKAKSKNQSCKHVELVVLHGTVGSADGIEFSATSRRAAVTIGGGNGTCGKGFCKENSTLMEVEMFVGDVVPKIANDPGFNGVGCHAPFVGGGGKNIKAAWMRKANFLFYEFFGSLVSGKSNVCVKWNKRGMSWKGIRQRKRSIGGVFVGHDFVFVMKIL
jgi:hypothetical protein